MERKVWVVLLSLLALFTPSGSKEFPVHIGPAINMYMNALKKLMPCGHEPLDIPVLAPYHLNKYPLNIENENYGITGEATNIYLFGLENFIIMNCETNQGDKVTQFDIFVPKIQLVAALDADMWAMVAGYKLNVSGPAQIDVKVENVRVYGEFGVPADAHAKMKIQGSDLNINIGYAYNHHLFHSLSEFQNDFYNTMLDSLLLFSPQEAKPYINQLIEKLVIDRLNKQWEDKSPRRVVTYLLQQGSGLNKLSC